VPGLTSRAASRERGGSASSRFTLDNRSGYETEDLRTFFAKGLRAMKVRGPRHIVVVAAPARSRGCAEVGTPGAQGRNIVIAIAGPARYCLRRLARLFEHEVTHTLGYEHEAMSHNVLWSLGLSLHGQLERASATEGKPLSRSVETFPCTQGTLDAYDEYADLISPSWSHASFLPSVQCENP